MNISFIKMHALGNDFVVINNTQAQIELTSEKIRILSDRHCGIGFDQLMVIENANYEKSEFYYRIFNADGQEVYQCGNGARCVAKYLVESALCAKSYLHLTTARASYPVSVTPDKIVVNMGIPIFAPEQIPFIANNNPPPCLEEKFNQEASETFGACSLGNPHAVLCVQDLDHFPVKEYGKQLGQDVRFPEGVNVGFMEVINSNQVRLRVYERGTGETLACGSGACAAVVIGRLKYGLAEEVSVLLRGGELKVSWKGIGYPVVMSGGATTVFEGQLNREYVQRYLL